MEDKSASLHPGFVTSGRGELPANCQFFQFGQNIQEEPQSFSPEYFTKNVAGWCQVAAPKQGREAHNILGCVCESVEEGKRVKEEWQIFSEGSFWILMSIHQPRESIFCISQPRFTYRRLWVPSLCFTINKTKIQPILPVREEFQISVIWK